MGLGLDHVSLTRMARDILALADECGLHPHISATGPGGYGRGRTQVMIDSCIRDGLFGTIIIGRNGQILRGFLVHGNWAEERRYEGAGQVRNVIASWAALMQSERRIGG
jgi:hypothetical protein